MNFKIVDSKDQEVTVIEPDNELFVKNNHSIDGESIYQWKSIF